MGDLIDSIGMNRTLAAVGKRVMRIRAGVNFHPLNLLRSADESLLAYYERFREDRAERIKNGIVDDGIRNNFDENLENEDGSTRTSTPEGAAITGDAEDTVRELTEAAADGADTSELSSSFRGRLARGSGAAGAVALVCGLQKIGDVVGEIKHANVILPLLRIGMEAITTSSQTSSNLAFDVDELGAASDMLYDEKTGTSAFAAGSLQDEMGEVVTGPEISESARPDTGKPRFFRTLDSVIDRTVIGNSVCDAVTTQVGGWVIDITSWVTTATGPVSAFGQAVLDIGIGYAAGYFIDDMVRWLVARQLEDFPQGAEYGNYANYGAFLAANDDAISSGGIELTPAQAMALKTETNEYLQKEIKNQNFFTRFVDPYNPNSLMAKSVIMQPKFSSIGSLTDNLASAPYQVLQAFKGGIGTLFFGNRVSAASGNHDYGVSQYAFSVEDMDDPAYENPIEVENRAEAYGIDYLNKEYGEPCFGTTIDPSSYVIRFSETKNYDELTAMTKCKDRSNPELQVMRFYIHYMKVGKSMLCYNGIDESACGELGFPNSGLAANPTPDVINPGQFAWPLGEAFDISACWNEDRTGLTAGYFHSGLDIRAPMSTPILASADGTVTTAKNTFTPTDTGKTIIIQHQDGLYTQYQHLETVDVTVGQSITQGQVIGTADSTGSSTGSHLHFNIQRSASITTRASGSLNPLDYLPVDNRNKIYTRSGSFAPPNLQNATVECVPTSVDSMGWRIV
jgi:murein DD-endopeptidase MepM/ murein hydrolase activator NlpD